MADIKTLLAQREELDAKIREMQKSEKISAIASVRQMVAEFALKETDIFSGGKPSKTKGSTVTPKYRDPATGRTWTGRGKPPAWIRDQDRAKFTI